MILGLNAVANPIEYGVFSKSNAQYERWDGLGHIEASSEAGRYHGFG